MKSNDPETAFRYAVAKLIRGVLYAPDGQPPEGWTIGQDLRIAKMIAAAGHTDIEDAIRGLRVLYPTGKLTLKFIASKKSREAPGLYQRAVAAGRKGPPHRKMAQSVRDFLKGAA